MRRLMAAVAFLGAIAFTGACDSSEAAPEIATPTSSAPRPAAVAGGVCRLLDYDTIEQALGVRFEVSAAGQEDATFTCVLQRKASSLPDLLLIVSSTTVDTTTFRNMMTPTGSVVVTGLGRTGYRIVGAANTGRGPIIEVSWLSANNRHMTLRYTTPAQTTAAAVNEAGAKLAELAKVVDKTVV